MQDIAPFEGWEQYYRATEDERSVFFEAEYNTQYYENAIYGYYIHPYWDFIESETLYVKQLFADYDLGFVIIELLGEWNDTLHNDVMFLKRNVIDPLVLQGINKFILLGGHVLNFHGGDDDYYAEWAEDVEEGWIVGLDFRDHVLTEWSRYRIDYYINFGGTLAFENWRTFTPRNLFARIDELMRRRLGPG